MPVAAPTPDTSPRASDRSHHLLALGRTGFESAAGSPAGHRPDQQESLRMSRRAQAPGVVPVDVRARVGTPDAAMATGTGSAGTVHRDFEGRTHLAHPRVAEASEAIDEHGNRGALDRVEVYR